MMYQCVYLVGTPPLRRRTGMNMNRLELDSESWIILRKYIRMEQHVTFMNALLYEHDSSRDSSGDW